MTTSTDGAGQLPIATAVTAAMSVAVYDPTQTDALKNQQMPVGQLALQRLIDTAIPTILLPSSFMANNGVFVIGQAPSSAATASFSATSGAGVTMTFSAATLLGTAADVGRVLTILDTTYKYAVITAATSTTVATVTITGVLSGLGPFANNAIWLSGTIPGTGNTVAFSSPLRAAYAACYCGVPAGAIAAGVPAAAAVYYCTMQSTTVGTLWNNVLASGEPFVPVSPIAFLTTGPGAFAQTTGSNIPLLTVPVPGSFLGARGRLRIVSLESNNNSANSKTYATQLAGNSVFAGASTTNQMFNSQHDLQNRGVTNAQVSAAAGVTSYGGTASAPTEFAVDTTVAQNLTFTGNLASANDWVMYDQVYVEAYRKP